MYGAREDLCRRGRSFVDERHQGYVLIAAVAVGAVFLARRLAALGVDDELVLGQKLIHHLCGRGEDAPRVVAQVDDQILEFLLRELGQRNEHLGIGSLSEALDAYVSCGLVEHVGSGNAVLRNLSARYREILDALGTIAHDADLHLRVLRAFQPVHGFFGRNLLSNEGLPIHADNLVACQKSRLLGRPVLHHILHMDRILTNGKLNAHPRERSFQVVGSRLSILRADIHRVRVELRQDLRDGPIDERIYIHIVHILIVYEMEQVVEPVAAVVDDVEPVAGEVVGKESADGDAYHYGDGNEERRVAIILVLIHFLPDLDRLLRCGLS